MNSSSSDEVNNDEDAPEASYDGKNMNAYSNNEENNYEVVPDPPTDDENVNANCDYKKYYYEVTPDITTNGVNNETIDNDEEKTMKMKLIRKQIMKT